MNLNRDQVGHLGEMYVLYKLAKLGLKGVKLQDMFDFDILLQNSLMLEIKTAKIMIEKDSRKSINYYREIWSFLNFKRKIKYLKNSQFKFIDEKRDKKCELFSSP